MNMCSHIIRFAAPIVYNISSIKNAVLVLYTEITDFFVILNRLILEMDNPLSQIH